MDLRSLNQDERITICKDYIDSNLPDQALSRDKLAKLVHLSPSRLSHLFKAEAGISIRNYIIWARLKHTIQTALEQEVTLLEAGYQAGFYDAAHFSRAFLKMFGVNPSTAYNSSTLQI